MARKKYSIDSRIDYSVILPVFFFANWFVAVYIATSNDYPGTIAKEMTQQGVWIFLGCVVAFVVMLFSTEFLWKVTLICMPWAGFDDFTLIFIVQNW